MRDNILAKRLNGCIRAKHAFHLTKHFFAFLYGGAVGHLLQCVIGRINQTKRVLIEFQMNHTAFVVDWAGGAVLHRLRHIVNVDVITEHLSDIAVFDRNRRPRKSDKGCVRKRIVQNARVADYNTGFLVAIGILRHHYAFVKSVLPTMRFVCHNHNVVALGKRLLSLFKFEQCSKDNAVCFASSKQGFQMFFVFGLHGCLMQKIGALAELRIQLVVKVNAVGHNDNGRAVQHFLQQMSIKHHRKRLTAALSVPKNAAFAVGLSSNHSFFYGFAHSEILVVTR